MKQMSCLTINFNLLQLIMFNVTYEYSECPRVARV